MGVFAALDGSQDETAICVFDADGMILGEAKVPTCHDAIDRWLRNRFDNLERIGMATGPLSVWLWNALTERDFPIVCLNACHATAC